MIKKVKQTKLEKILVIFLIILSIVSFGSYISIKDKCLFVKDYDPQKLNFEDPKNIVILNTICGNVIIELYPKLSPNSVKRFKMLIKNNEYDNVAFHRVIKDVLVQTGDLEFGKKENLNYAKIGTGKSGYGKINSELEQKFDFSKGSIGFARTEEINSEDSQFFILLTDAPLFEKEYTPLGKVIYGLEGLTKIKYNEKSEYVLRPDFINTFKILVD